MWGAVLWNVGDEELEVRDDFELRRGPGANEVQVRIRATGLCHTDVSTMAGVMPAVAPALLGHEASGEIVAVGEGVHHVKVGDHIIIAASRACGRCFFCLGGQVELCDGYDIFALEPRHRLGDQDIFPMANLGTFVEEMILPVEGVVVIPKDVPFDVAAIIGCAVVTGVGAAINAAKVQPGSSVAVFGCGGVGMSVIQGARIAGAADIVAIDPVPARRDAALQMGATRAVGPDDVTQVGESVHGGRGFDYAFEVVGVPETIRAAYDSARRGGTVVVVGAGGVDKMVSFSAFELFYQEKQLLGVLMGSSDPRRDFSRFLRLWRAGRLDLDGMITRRLKIHEINDGIAALRRGEGIRQVVEFA
jgi:S-(hydroxymethyl)glutathione dehydrogenase/alcohol dehydrogenase